MNWIFAFVAVAAVGLLNWDVFVRGRRGAALLWGTFALVVLLAAGIARGAGATGHWPLVALIVGGVLFIVAERTDDATSSDPAP